MSVSAVGREGDAEEIAEPSGGEGGASAPGYRARARLLRWGWPAAEAEAMATRLARRDREGDDRTSCAAECAHYRTGGCGNHKRAGLRSPELGRDLAGLLQRCPGFETAQ